MASLSLEVPAPYLEVGETVTLVATPLSSSGSPLTGRPITYTSSDTDIASVSDAGEVRGVTPGTVSIRATAESVSATVELAVRENGPLPQTLRDTIRRVDFIIQEGAVHVAEGDLVIVADRTIRVAGELRLASGVGLKVFSDSLLEITGSITGASSLDAPAATSPALNACPGFEEPADFTFAADVMEMRGGNIQTDGAIYIAGVAGKLQSSVHITEGFLLTSGRGANGCKGQPGDAGYPIEIGTFAAWEKATLALGKGAAQVKALLLRSATLVSGDGGDGFSIVSNAQADDGGATLVAQATSGGRGGDIRLTAAQMGFNGALVQAGSGGHGGSVGHITVRDGTSGKGQNLMAGTGHGGEGGDVVVTGPVLPLLGNTRIGSGEGGRAGLLFDVRGGNGGPTHDGGDFSVHVGAAGNPGSTTGVEATLPPPPRNDTVEVSLRDAFNGGASDSPARTGGNGGSLELRPTRAVGIDLRLSNVGNGATGFDGCIPIPNVAGTRGGGGGTLTLNAVALGESTDEETIFRAGAGGHGAPPANGGTPGIEVTTNRIFGPVGPRGVDCAIINVTPTRVDAGVIRYTLDCGPLEIDLLDLEASVDLDLHHAWQLTEGGKSPHATPRTQDAEPEIRLEPASFPLKADEPRSVKVILTCEATESFSGVLTLIGTSEESTASVDVPVSVTIEHEAVLLAATLGGIASGSEIRLARISNGYVGGPEAGCAEPHLHAPPPGILVDGDGPFPDPNPTGCGYGVIVFTEGGR